MWEITVWFWMAIIFFFSTSRRRVLKNPNLVVVKNLEILLKNVKVIILKLPISRFLTASYKVLQS